MYWDPPEELIYLVIDNGTGHEAWQARKALSLTISNGALNVKIARNSYAWQTETWSSDYVSRDFVMIKIIILYHNVCRKIAVSLLKVLNKNN